MSRRLAKKLLSVLLVLSLVIGFVSFAGEQKVYAAVVETHDAEELKTLLESSGDVTIKLNNHVDYKMPDNSSSWCSIGDGVKTLDLNGCDLNIKQENNLNGGTFTMILIGSGATLIINDSSGKNKGEILSNGYIKKWVSGAAGSHTADYWDSSVLYRNVFKVSGGNLIFNSGKIIGGRRKEQYVGYGIDVSDIKDVIEYGKVTVPLNVRYDGKVDKIINCNAITMTSGSVMINGGVIEGRGFKSMDTTDGINFSAVYTKNATINATGGTLVINGGEIVGLSGANPLRVADGATVTVRAGEFSTYTNDRILYPVSGAYLGVVYPPVFVTGVKGSVSNVKSYVDTSVADVNEDGSSVSVTPKEDGKLTLYNDTYAEEVGKHIDWDGTTDVILTADLTPYFPEEDVPYNKSKDNGLIHYLGALAQSSKELGVTAAITFGGETISEGGEATEIEKKLTTSKILDESTAKMTIHLKDLVPDGLKMGESFLVTVRWSDALYNAANNPAAVYTERTEFTVTLKENDLVITEHPKNASSKEAGETVTLTAKAENATGAFWEQTYPSSGSILDGTFDASTGIATLTVSVTDYAKYVCCFKNSMGLLKTDEASVLLVAQPNVGETETKEVQWSKKSDTVYLVAGGGAPAAKVEQRWYYRASEGDDWTQLEKIAGKMDPNLYDNTLALKNPEDSDAGYYRLESDYQNGDETVTIWSGFYHVTVVDGFTDKTVVTDTSTPLMVYGMPEFYVGDVAPSEEQMLAVLYTDDDRVSITQFKWNAADLTDGKFNSTTPHFSMTIASKISESCKLYFDSWGRFFVGIGDKIYASVSETTIDDVAYGAVINKNVIQGIVSGEANWYVPPVMDQINMENSYFVKEGEEVDLQLEPTVNCHIRHQEAGTTHDTVDNYELYDAGHSEYKLPDGLTLSSDGRITGTVTQEASTEPTFIYVAMHIAGNDEENWKIPVRFYVTPVVKTMSLPISLKDLHHEHTYGEWTDTGDGETHVHECTVCGSQEALPHDWDDGVVTTPATGSTAGVMTYTCSVCGAVKTEEIEPHKIVKTEEVPSTCIREGSASHYECEDCGEAFEDEAGTKPITDSTEIQLPLSDHDWDDWTEKDADTHVHTCKVCGEEETEAHQWDEGVVTKEPTVEEEGEKTFTCSACGAKKTEPIAKLLSVTVMGDGNGTAVADKTSGATGEEIKLFPVPNSGYQFKEWQVISGGVTISDDKFTLGTENVEIKAIFEKVYVLFITIDPSEGGKVQAASEPDKWVSLFDLSFPEGEQTITAQPAEGYQFVKWTDSEGKDVSTENPYTFNLDHDTELVAVFEKISEDTPAEKATYNVVSGGDSTWTSGSSDGVTITVKRSIDDQNCFKYYTETLIDGKKVEVEAKSGSTIVTISAAVLEQLKTGKHTITIGFEDGKAETSLTIGAAPTPGSSETDTPETGDSGHLGIWIALLILSAIGLGGAWIFIRKRRCAN